METIKIKSKNTCNLFRCILCWKYILADDNITDYNDGYVHNICNDRRLKKKQQYIKDTGYIHKYYIKNRDKIREYYRNYYYEHKLASY